MFEQKEGPSDYKIPAQKFKICSGCKYYDHHMVKSGHNPVYRQDCRHPDSERYSVFGFHGNLDSYDRMGMIETPDWCPFLKKKVKKDGK